MLKLECLICRIVANGLRFDRLLSLWMAMVSVRQHRHIGYLPK